MFFGSGILHNQDDREFLVKGLLLNVRYTETEVQLACYYPMPFFNSARIELYNPTDGAIADLCYEIRTEPYNGPASHVGYFHATYSDHPEPTAGVDLVFLDTNLAEGGGPWSGSFVGMTWIFSHDGVLNTLEGDPRFYFDDSRTPQAIGTGTEEWGGGGDYWGGRNMTIPLAGHPVGRRKSHIRSDRELVNSAYRILVADLFPFGRRAIIGLEHGGGNMSTEHYKGVVYWYGGPMATLQLSDQLNVCDEADVRRHRYTSTHAEVPYTLVSRFDAGPDTDAPGWWQKKGAATGARLFVPAEEDMARISRGTNRFVVSLVKENHGVLLRREFDYFYPNQSAKVSIRAVDSQDHWNEVGIWYTAGSNTTVHSRPAGKNFSKAELAPTEHNVNSSNRRWREEEFLLPRRLTHGLDKIEVQIEWLPDDRPLYPGHPYPEKSGWSESRYWVYSYVLP